MTDHPLVRALGAGIAQGPITNGLAAVPLPLITQPQAEKSAFELMVIAAGRCGSGWPSTPRSLSMVVAKLSAWSMAWSELMLSKIIEAVPAIARDLASLASHRRSLGLIGP